MSKLIKLLMVLVLFAGVTACSSAETEVEPVDEVAIEEAIEEAPAEAVVVEPTEEAPACGTFSFVVDGEFPANAKSGVIDTQAVVTGVNRPNDAKFDAMTVENGNAVEGSTYEPTADDTDVGIAAGTSYNMFMITQDDGAQAFVVWSPDEPVWQDLLKLADTAVAGLGMPGPNTLRRGDKVTISVQAAEGGGIDVTMDVCRAEESAASSAAAEEEAAMSGGLVYGTDIHLQNQYADEQTYLDTRGWVTDKPQFAEVAQTERTFVSTHGSSNRGKGSGTWTIESVEGKTKGDAVAIGDAVYLVNGYPGAGYLDTWGYTARHPVWDDIVDSTLGVYTTLDRSRIDDERTATWYIRSAAGKADGEPVAEGDPIHLESAYDNPNPGMPDGGFLDTNSSVTPYTEFSEYEGQRLFVFTSPMQDRDRGSGTWVMRVAEAPSADAADNAPEAAASTGPVTLEGQVVSATTGEPISGVEVCHDESGDCATSSDTGTFVIEQAVPGQVTLALAHDDHIAIDHSFDHSGEGHFEKVVLSPNLATGEIRITLSWDPGSDLDSHLWLPESSPFEVYFNNEGASDGPPNALLDIDDTSTGGPETITINKRVDGTYHFAIHHYDCDDFGGVCDVAGKSPIVRVYGNAGLVEEFSSPTGVGEWWHVFSMDGLSGKVTPINVVQAAEPVTSQ